MLVIHNEKLLDFIKSQYDLSDIRVIRDFLDAQNTFHFPCLKTGLFSAAIVKEETKYTGYTSVWVRDNIHVAHAHYVVGKFGVAINTIQSLMVYFHQHRHRFQKIIDTATVPKDVMERPHIRFDGVNLQEIEQKWSHAQNDALGYFLWFYCKLVKEGFMVPKSKDLETLALFPLYLQTIAYWQDEDSGHWEEIRKISASSIGVVVAGLTSLKVMLIQQPNLSKNINYKAQHITIDFLEKLINKGSKELTKILPFECIKSGEKKREYDGALLFLIYPLRIINDHQSAQIIKNTTNYLQGDYGIKRYLGDSFWTADYKKKLAPEIRTIDFSDNLSFRDSLIQENKEAQWCIFDPILSIIFGWGGDKSPIIHTWSNFCKLRLKKIEVAIANELNEIMGFLAKMIASFPKNSL